MEQEKEFTVTDKRSSFKSDFDSSAKESTPTAKTSQPAATQDQEPRQTGNNAPPIFPEANLLTLIFSLYTHCQICLGVLPDPMTQQKMQKDLLQAKYNIDLLEVLQEKTKGNLTQEEASTLESILYDVRMAYIQASK